MKRKALIFLTVVFAALTVFSGCRKRIVYTGPGDWLQLVTNDPNETGVAYNGQNLYVDANFSDNTLNFMIKNYAAIPATDSGVFLIFLDTDRNATTGFNKAKNWNYSPNDMGAEYMLLIGSETANVGGINANSLYTWGDTIWTNPRNLATNTYVANTDSIIGGVNMADIGSPATFDVMAIFVGAFLNTSSETWDYLPNSGHATVRTDSGTVVQPTYLQIIAKSAPSPERISIITGKVLD